MKVSRVPVRRRENDPTTSNQAKTDLRALKTIVRDLHAEPMRVTITVTDRLPYSENAAITVEQLRETTPPTELAPGDRRGVMVWTFDLAPGETREIRLAYRLPFPSDREIVLEAKPVKAGSRPWPATRTHAARRRPSCRATRSGVTCSPATTTRCVLCGDPGQDAHHILERRLFTAPAQAGGYFLANGATVCGPCHLLCEATEIDVEAVRRAAS